MLEPARWSLARRQLVILLSALTIAALALGGIGAWYIAGYAERTSDRVLSAAVSSIAQTIAVEEGRITLEVPPSAFGMLEDAARDNVYYSVRSGGALVTGYADFPRAEATPAPDEIAFRYDRYLDQRVRVATQARYLPRWPKPVIIEVAETLDERGALIRAMLTRLALIEAVLVLLAALLVWPAVRWSLRPVTALRGRLAGRGADHIDLAPLDTADVPAELKGLVDSFNGLLRRTDAAIEGVRRFTADASHQMRTPLAVLRTHVAMVRQAGADATAAAGSLADIESATVRLQRLLSQLLALARVEDRAANPVAARTSIVLDEQAADAARAAAPDTTARGVEIAFEPGLPAGLAVTTDPMLLNEILANLIDNAVRYNRAGGTVIVRTLVEAGRPIIAVDDDGPGIPPGERELVFRRFHRLQRDQNSSGSGLGLPIVRALAEVLGLDVSIADSDLGGTRIRVAFPAVDG